MRGGGRARPAPGRPRLPFEAVQTGFDAPVVRGQPTRVSPAALAALVLTALALFAATQRVGLVAFALPTLALVTVVMVQRPGWCLGAMAGAALLFEQGAGSLTSGPWLYQERIAGVSVFYGLIGLFLAAAGLAARRRPEGLGLRPGVVAACAVLAVAVLGGVVTGNDAGISGTVLYDGALALLPLIALPFAVAATLDSAARLRTALVVAAALTTLKAALGLASLITGVGSPGNLGGEDAGTRLTYYEPATNWLCLIMLLVGAAAIQRRVRLPAWAWAAMPLVVGSLLLSYRRSFWLATILGLVVVLALGSSRLQFRLAIPVLGSVALLTWLTLGLGIVQDPLDGSVGERARSLNPTEVAVNAQDRYRLDERANAVAEIRDHPVAGLGIGVPWRARHPLAIEHGRQYVHVAVLWFWLKFGVLGAIGYVMAMGAGALAGLRASRRRDDPVLRCAGAAVAASFLGLALAETTATFVGPDPRMTVLFGVALGLASSLAAGTASSGRSARSPAAAA